MIRLCWTSTAVMVAAMFLTAFSAISQNNSPENRSPKPGQGEAKDSRRGEIRMPTPAFHTEVPEHNYDLILGRPTAHSVTLSVLAYRDMEGIVVFSPVGVDSGNETPPTHFSAGEPVELKLTSLKSDTDYNYQLVPRDRTKSGITSGPQKTFHTARPPGSKFIFTIQADSHLDYGTEPEIYLQSLTNALNSRPDFHIDLGDTFMTDKYLNYSNAAPQYLAQRFYLGVIGQTVPVFLVLGNHDGETIRGRGDDAMAIWSNSLRKKYFPNPVPDEFYLGNSKLHPRGGLLQDYYAWTWGDALFVVLDPFWFSASRGRNSDNWDRTLGLEQYRWLQQTLERSQASFKFIFLHNLVGGETREGRGGAEAARYFEWGGRELDGRMSFAEKRSGWPSPIQDILVKNKVNIVFHGHDHLYARQELDDIIYQEVPQPDHARGGTQSAVEYGYKSGVIEGGSGILRVTVTSTNAFVEYVRAYNHSELTSGKVPGTVTQSYEIKAR